MFRRALSEDDGRLTMIWLGNCATLAVSVNEYIEQVGCTDTVPLSHAFHGVASIGSQRADDHFDGAESEKSETKQHS